MHLEESTSRPMPLPHAAVIERFLDWGVALGGLWLIGGLHLDGWAHRHIRMETFFTPWHAVLYSGFAVTAAVVGLGFLDGLRRGRAWQRALPAAYASAYRTALLGAILFLIGGLADMTWHTLFGIEVSLEALLSPPHLLLAFSAGLLITGPLRAALYRQVERGPQGEQSSPGIPALLSTINLVALLAFFTQYVHPFIELSQRFVPDGLSFVMMPVGQPQMVGAVMLQSAILMGAVLLLVRIFRLPFGSLTLLFTLTTGLAVSMTENWGMISIALVGGLAADVLARLLRPGERANAARLARDWATRLFAFLVPAVLYLIFFAAFHLEGVLGLAPELTVWSLELWGGTVLLAGFAGWLLSYAFFPSVVEP